jgi:hypothetical protein
MPQIETAMPQMKPLGFASAALLSNLRRLRVNSLDCG